MVALGRRYGELDGELSWRCATAFAAANRTLTSAQRAELRKLRNLEGYESAPAYIYSRPVRELPAIPAPDFLFTAPAEVNRAVRLEVMKGPILAKAELTAVCSRPAGTTEAESGAPR